MSRTKLTVIAVIIAALFAFKALFPSTAGNIIDKASLFFESDINYRQVFNDLGDYVAAYREDAKGEKTEEATAQTGLVLAPVETERGGWSPAELAYETAVNEGERYKATPAAVPEAVAAFLESQEAYSDYALPVNVSYDYTAFPEAYETPVAGYNSSGFGYRLHPIKGEVRFHYGTDFAAWSGEDIYAFADGTVSFAGYSDSYGNYITIDHADGWQSLYAHCSLLYVESGDSVSAGEKIALVGETGLATGPHLHFELTKDGMYVNPEYYVN